MSHKARKPGIYQVWHDRRDTGRRIASALGGDQARFPGDYAHVADVEAESLSRAAELTTGIGDSLFDPDNWQPWTVRPEARALTAAPRETWFGDVIVDPRGEPFRRMGSGGFEAIPARERPGWQTQAEVAAEEMAGAAEDAGVIDRAHHRGLDPAESLDEHWREQLPIKAKGKGPEIG